MGNCRSAPKGEEVKQELIEVTEPIPDVPNVDPVTSGEDHSAKEADLQWMNYMIRVMWPYVRQAMMKVASAKFHEKMSEELAKHPEVVIDTLDLDFDPGNKPPRITGLLVYQRTQQERTGLQVDVDFSWKPDKDFHVKMSIMGHAKAFPINAQGVGVSGMDVGGTMSCLMSPLLDVIPCVGTGQAFFLDTPKMNMHVIGMKKLGPIGGLLTTMMQGVVSNVLAEGFILPHRFVQKVRKDLPLETMVTMKSPLPLGVLMVEVLEGRDLPASDTSITGKKSSDPFVEVKVGYGKVRSSTIENTLNPKWSDPPCHLLVYNVAQLVRISVHDDDVMGADSLGCVVGYNVFLLCQQQKAVQQRDPKKDDGMWLKLQDSKGKPAGMIKLRVRYFDVEHIDKSDQIRPVSSPTRADPPFLMTVKLLGLEAEDRGDLRNTRATVELVHPEEKSKEEKVDKEAHHANRLMAGLEAGISFMKTKVKAATGLGFGHLEDGVTMKKKSGKAVLWGSQKQLEDADHHIIPPMAIRAMEKLHIREGWPITKVANMFQLDPEVVKTAVGMRGNFEVVWHEALHFLQPPSNPYLGKVLVSVQAPKSNQVRGADDSGFLGQFEIDLDAAAMSSSESGTGEASQPWKRRVRQMLYRPKAAGGKSESTEVFQTKRLSKMGSQGENENHKEGDECTGILIELVVETRLLVPAPCELDEGQTLRDRQSLIDATTSSGVKMIPE